MAKFICLIGFPASGKSSYAMAHQNSDTIVVSTDTIRKDLFGNENNQEYNDAVFKEAYNRILDCLNNNFNCIFDATNLVKKRRSELLKKIPENIETEAIVMLTEFDVIFKQNQERERNVPESAYKRMIRVFSLPQKDEGWDKITYYDHPQNSKILDDYVEMCKGFNQRNPHHSYDLYTHCATAAQFVEDNWEQYGLNLREKFLTTTAARFHDIGKLYTKTFTLWSGKEDNCAHYYNHAEIGAYLFYCTVVLNEEARIVGELIRRHMDMYDEKVFEKIRDEYGERFMIMSKCLHDADKVAH